MHDQNFLKTAFFLDFPIPPFSSLICCRDERLPSHSQDTGGYGAKGVFFDDDNNNNKHLIMRQYWRIINVNKERKGDK